MGCRSNLLDWALLVQHSAAHKQVISALLDGYDAAFPEYPMTVTVQTGLVVPEAPKRRGGKKRGWDENFSHGNVGGHSGGPGASRTAMRRY